MMMTRSICCRLFGGTHTTCVPWQLALQLLKTVRNQKDMIWVGQHFSRDGNDRTDHLYLEAIWQLVSLSVWAIGFLERLMKECLLTADLIDTPANGNEFQPKLEPVDDTDIFTLEGMFFCILHSLWSGSPTSESKRCPDGSPLDSPILLHLTHPFILPNLIGVIMHVNRFYHSLSALTPKGENSQIARDILMDVIDCSGLDLRGIEDILKVLMPDVRSISGELVYPVPLSQALNLHNRRRSKVVTIKMSSGPCSIPIPTKSGTHTAFIYSDRQTAFVYQGCRSR